MDQQRISDYQVNLCGKGEKETFPSRESADAPSRNVFERYINQIGIIAFGTVLSCSWELLALTFQLSWFNGGPASLVYGTIIAGLGQTAVAAALGEMASIDPAIGAQYRWSARFATRSPEFWGFIQGWLTVFAWISSALATFVIMTNSVIGLIVFNNPTYEPKSWHTTLFVIAFATIPVPLVLFFRRVCNVVEGIAAISHVIVFIPVVTVLGTLARRSTPDFVFTTLHRDSGWDNPGVAFSIGVMLPALSLSASDGILHMVDETKQPRKTAPRAMVISTVLNFVLELSFVICLLFCIGNTDAPAISRYPLVEVFYSATGSKAASTVLAILPNVPELGTLLNCIVSSSRLVWAFARDKGIPYNQYLTPISPRLQAPLRAIVLVTVVCCLLSLVNLGSSVAFNSIISLASISLFVSYTVPIGLLLVRQLKGQHPQYGPFTLGRCSIPIKVFALCYLLYLIPFVAMPTSRPVTSENMNYAAPIFGGVVFIALIDWFVNAHKRFEVPTAPLIIEED